MTTASLPTSKYDRSIIEGAIGPAVWRLAWPTMLQHIIAGLQRIIDHVMTIGRIRGGLTERPLSDAFTEGEWSCPTRSRLRTSKTYESTAIGRVAIDITSRYR